MRMKLLAVMLSLPLLLGVAAPTSFPAPRVGEFGPQVEVSDGLSIASLVTGDGNHMHRDGDGAPDVVGAFRFLCAAGQNNKDDPIVAPGKLGGGPHTHQWYGNLGGRFDSTYATLRRSGNTTCGGKGNRTAYWMPDMRSGGRVLRPDWVAIYYKRYPKASIYCQQGTSMYVGDCVGIPNGLSMIFGYDFKDGTSPAGSVAFKCIDEQSWNSRSDYKKDMVEAASHCRLGDVLDVTIHAPECWDGAHLDSANHRDHVAYRRSDGRCPGSHPKLMPAFTLQAAYRVDSNLDRSGYWSTGQRTWYLSCDRMSGSPDQRPGTCMHQDYFEGWNNRIKKAWMDHCIDRMLNCSGGDLGNGYALKPDVPVTATAATRYVAIPGGSSMSHSMLHSRRGPTERRRPTSSTTFSRDYLVTAVPPDDHPMWNSFGA